MTFRYDPMDICIADGATGGPEFLTVIAESESGNEQRDRMRSKDKGVWDVSYAARLEHIWRPLRDFFVNMGGRDDSWPFRDPLDHECTTAEAIIVQIDSTHWQMYKRYTIGSLNYDRKIVLPYSTVVSGSGSYSVGAQTGIITKSSGADPTGFSTMFYKPARFDTDRMVANAITHKPNGKKIVEWAAIPIKEVNTKEVTG